MEELKTKSELMAEMQDYADYINGVNGSTKFRLIVSNVSDDNVRYLGFWFDGRRIGMARQYRQDSVAPADGRAVIVGYFGNIRVSRGMFSSNGNLQTYEDTESGYSRDDGWTNWCDYLDRDHHSPGWQKEWEPKE